MKSRRKYLWPNIHLQSNSRIVTQSIRYHIAVLQEQVQAFSEFRGSDRIMKSLKGVISVLSTLSEVTSDDAAIARERKTNELRWRGNAWKEAKCFDVDTTLEREGRRVHKQARWTRTHEGNGRARNDNVYLGAHHTYKC
jgi:hypothetical protein